MPLRLVKSLSQLLGQSFKLLVGELYMVVEVHVAFVLHGDKMYVGVGYFEA